MKTQNFGENFKEINIGIGAEKTQLKNQIYINDLINLKEHTTIVPTFTPKKFIDQIQFVLTGGSYYLYIYLDNTWKRVQLT